MNKLIILLKQLNIIEDVNVLLHASLKKVIVHHDNHYTFYILSKDLIPFTEYQLLLDHGLDFPYLAEFVICYDDFNFESKDVSLYLGYIIEKLKQISPLFSSLKIEDIEIKQTISIGLLNEIQLEQFQQLKSTIKKYFVEIGIEKDFSFYVKQDNDELNHLFVINKDTIDTTKKILSRYGIKFIIVPKFDKTPIDGFSFWQGENPTIVLTLRLNRIDNYAFALLHEIYHVYMHLFNNREQKYISIEGAEINKCEEEANKFAKYSLISKDLWSAFLKQHSMISPHAMQMKIKQFAHQHNINEAIVLGFYQHDINLYSIKSSISREIK